jgi:hypothetical protein
MEVFMTATSFDALFGNAASDWFYIPPPPPARKGGGTAPRITSRAISVEAYLQDVEGTAGIDGSGGPVLWTGPLNYTPGGVIQTSKGPYLVHPTFSGILTAGDGNIRLTIVSEAEYFTTIDIVKMHSGSPPPEPTSVSFNPNPPKGEPSPTVNDPSLNVSFDASGKVNNAPYSFAVQLEDYNFSYTMTH